MLDLRGLRRELGGEPRLFAAPGRVNLIGEHTDYNDGFVLPMAIDRRTVVAARIRTDRVVRVRSRRLDGTADIELDAPGARRRGIWCDYVEGVARELDARGTPLVGADLLVDGDVPLGAGLSSSASLEIAVGTALVALSDATIDGEALALAAQAAEHAYVGTRCGIMDQLVAAVARPGHALFLDCRSREARHEPIDPERAAVLVCDTGVAHALSSSAYNERRASCEEAVRRIARVLSSVRALRDLSVDDLERHAGQLDEVTLRRCRHVVGENARTEAAAAALAAGDLDMFGRLMRASHVSLRDDYEVSCAELDALADALADVPGVFGARMTGGGFGGSVIALVAPGALEAARGAAERAFVDRFGRAPATFVTKAAAGAAEIGADGWQ